MLAMSSAMLLLDILVQCTEVYSNESGMVQANTGGSEQVDETHWSWLWPQVNMHYNTRGSEQTTNYDVKHTQISYKN